MFAIIIRCFAVINPIKSESRSAESWRGLITRIRHLMLTAYDRTLSRFEDIIREQRERRNNPSWNFCHYFLLQVVKSPLRLSVPIKQSYINLDELEVSCLFSCKVESVFQEELAFALQMLGLFDEALVQYDELDALFTQFVLNSNVGGIAVFFQSIISNKDIY